MPLRVRVFPEEPAYGLFHRLAARNGFANGPELAKRIGMSWREIQAGRQCERVAQLAGGDKASLSASSPVLYAKSRKVVIGVQQVPLGDWRSKPRRVCCACVLEDANRGSADEIPLAVRAYHRTLWDIWSITHCPEHRCILTERCPRCLVGLSWQDPAIGLCSCGHDLADSPPPTVGWEASNYLASLLQSDKMSIGGQLTFLSYIEAILNLELLGQVAIAGCSERLPKRGIEQRRTARQSGFAIAGSLERELPALLDANANLCATADGLLAAYGWVYGYWAYPDGHMHPRIRALLSKHAVSHGIMSPLEQRLGVKSETRTKSLVQVARQWGCSFETAKREICRQDRLPRGSRRGVATTITIAQRSPRPCGTRELARRWSIGRRTVQELVAFGHLVQDRQGICPVSASGLVTRLLRTSATVATDERFLPIADAAAQRNISLGQVLHAVLIGQLRAFRITRVDCSDWIARIAVDPEAISRQSCNAVPVESAGRLLGMHHEAVRQMVAGGYIERADSRGLCPVSVKAFASRFIALAELAREAGVAPRAQRELLSRKGIMPAFDRPQFRQIAYARSDLEGYA